MASRSRKKKTAVSRKVPKPQAVTPEPAPIGADWRLRAGNALIDAAILLVFLSLAGTALGIRPPSAGGNQSDVVYGAFLATGTAVYEILTVGLFAQTAGMKLLGLRVIATPGGGRPSWVRACLRALIFWVPPLLTGIWPTVVLSFMIAFVIFTVLTAFDKNRLALHDQWSGTAVVRES